MRRMRTWLVLSISVALVASSPLAASADTRGPASGTLFIVGGGMRDPALVRRFIELAGGPEAPIVIVPTAGDDDTYAQDYGGTKQFRDAGARQITVLHTRDRKVADTDAFVAPLVKARGVFFQGGRQWRLADSYLGTRTQVEVTRVLERGGVVGGSSAGATILGSLLVRGDTKGNELMVGDHIEGFGLLTDSAIDQHLLRRNRQFDLIPVIAERPHVLGIGIDEDTAIVVSQTRFEVAGNGYVAIYDGRRVASPPGGFYLLGRGDRFDLTSRSATRPPDYTPLEGVPRTPNFVSSSFVVPRSYDGRDYILRPLGPDLVEHDYAAYMGSIEHIRKTFGGGKWPYPGITRAEALKDVEGEQARFEARESFTYAVLTKDGSKELGCVYVSPSPTPGFDARVRTWVVEARAASEAQLRHDVKAWLAAAWPFKNVEWP
jgi:cyanophycinase